MGRQRCLSSLKSTDIKSHVMSTWHGVVYLPAFIFLFFLGIYILTSSGSVHGTIDGTIRYAVTKNIADSNSVSIPEDLGRNMGVMGINGKYYSWYGIGQSALMIPLYVIGKAVTNPEFMVSLFNPLITAITCVVIFLFCVNLGYCNRTSVIITLMYGLGTIAWPQSKGPFEHPLETILILLSVFFVYLHVRNKSYRKLILSSVFLGIAFITRSPSLLTLLPVLLYLLFSNIRKKTLLPFFKEAIIYGMTLVPFGMFYLYYNYVRFGDVFETGYSEIFNQWGVKAFGTPLHVGLYGLILSPGKGFFVYSPMAILFILAAKNFYKRNKDLTIAFLTFISAYVLFHSKYIAWHGDWAWGPRFLTVITPFLIIPSGELFESGMLYGRQRTLCSLKSTMVNIVVYLLLAVSILIQIAAVTVNLNKYFIKNHIPSRNIPNHIYFDPNYSPIKEQFKFVVEIARKIGYYTPPESRPDAADIKAINEQITINVPDFWYVYYIYAGIPKGSVVVMVIMLLALTVFSFVMILEKGIGNGE